MCNVRRDYFARHPLVTDKTWGDMQKTLHLFSSIAHLSREDWSAEFYTSIVYVTCRPSLVFPLRVRAHVSYFSFFAFTSSPTYCNAMIVNAFGVKAFAFRLHPLPHAPCLHRTARKVCFSAELFSKARKYRPETADGEGKNQKPSPQTNSTSTDCAQWVKE